MNGPGRPTLYKEEFAEQAYRLCLAGATNPDLAECFEVDRSTVDKWLQRLPEFAQAVRRGRAIADGEVAHMLYARATGYTYETTKVLLHNGEPMPVRHTVHCPPDVRAASFWLRNRRPQQWSAQAARVQDEWPDLRVLEEASERARREAA
jgi:hypothetical protein